MSATKLPVGRIVGSIDPDTEVTVTVRGKFLSTNLGPGHGHLYLYVNDEHKGLRYRTPTSIPYEMIVDIAAADHQDFDSSVKPAPYAGSRPQPVNSQSQSEAVGHLAAATATFNYPREPEAGRRGREEADLRFGKATAQAALASAHYQRAILAELVNLRELIASRQDRVTLR